MNKLLTLPSLQSLKPVVVVINPGFRMALYAKTKIACMVQDSFMPGQKLIIETVENESTIKIAEAEIFAVVGLRIEPKKERIFKREGGKWQPLTKDSIKQVLKNEGFKHSDDFFKIHKTPFEVNQLYFENLKLIA